MKRIIIALLVILIGLVMADVTSEGQDRIQSNDGQMKIGITERELKLTKPGVDPVDSTNENLILNDQQNVFKIVSQGTVTVPSTTLVIDSADNNDQAFVVVNHNLGFIPSVLAFRETNGIQVSFAPTIEVVNIDGGASLTDIWIHEYDMSVTSTAVSFIQRYIRRGVSATNSSGATYAAFAVKYYLLQETAD